MHDRIRVRGAREHNLHDLSVEIPHRQLTVITGVSGSGKSSLAFDTLHAFGQRHYLEALSSRARQFVHRLPPPRVDELTGLTPTIALAQQSTANQPRSTVGTMSGVGDLLRVAFARMGAREDGAPIEDLGPWLFSFNSSKGACPSCRGTGLQDRVDPDLLVADAAKTLRGGALVPTLPNGYIVYSQVTIDVLDQVCRAHGFDVDTPWAELTYEHRQVIFFGSDRIEVPFGKHALESRMKWAGITAKPRDLGHYRGLLPTIAETLQRNRNANVLRFARSEPCAACSGTRLSELARSVRVAGHSIADLAALPLTELAAAATALPWSAGLTPIAESVHSRIATMLGLGLGHLSIDRPAPSLSGGEAQRVRLAALARSGLSGVTFVLDEPSIGLHAAEEHAVLDTLRRLRDAGNTVIVVEHSAAAIAAADYLVDVGPAAGVRGGRLVYSGAPAGLLNSRPADDRARQNSATRTLYRSGAPPLPRCPLPESGDWLVLHNPCTRNLRGDDARFLLRTLNVVCGVAGSGKSSLVLGTLVPALRERLAPTTRQAATHPTRYDELTGADGLNHLVAIDASPIGRTPRSNLATYTGLFDPVRKLFAAHPDAKAAGLKNSHFSFNTKGGRCESCHGSGREEIGMHGLPVVEIECLTCQGQRFRTEILAVEVDGHSILDVLNATVEEAMAWFATEPRIHQPLTTLASLGLGYLTLGQPATTLSGGEAQRVKLASELARKQKGSKRTVYVLDEPTAGLHRQDISLLLTALLQLVEQGHTVLVIEHDLDVIRAAGHVLELGPGSGTAGGRIVFCGSPEELEKADSPTGRALATEPERPTSAPPIRPEIAKIELRGVRTHGLKDLDVEFAPNAFTVVTGVSGSGKSSLVFDTLHAESSARCVEHLSAHIRRQLGGGARVRGTLDHAANLRPTVALEQRRGGESDRSTVATLSDLLTPLRIAWSRAGVAADGNPTMLGAAGFSFLRSEGACPSCEGAGSTLRCDPHRLVARPDRPLFDGALLDAKVLRPYVDPEGKHRAVVAHVADALGIDIDSPWAELPEPARAAILHGTGDRSFDVEWQFQRGKRRGQHSFASPWIGFCAAIELEHAAKRGDERGVAIEREFMVPVPCSACGGERLGPEARTVTVGGKRLPELLRSRLADAQRWLERAATRGDHRTRSILGEVVPPLLRQLERLLELGLGHLALDRTTSTLSAGEACRVRLARQLAAPLHGVVYVLDEPTVGLHPRDVQGLITVLRELVSAGNGIVCVEHDPAVLRAADHLIELGPGAGQHGGRIVCSSSATTLPSSSRSAQLLRRSAQPIERTPRLPGPLCTIAGATLHDLDNLTVILPTQNLIAITGVSGSGKTSLVFGVLATSLEQGRPIGCSRLDGFERFARVVDVDPAVRTTSALATVGSTVGVLDVLRKQFAKTDAARAAGFQSAAFGYGSKAGQCQQCKGKGRTANDLDFLGRSWSVCDECRGARYRAEVLALRWRDRSIADWLALSVDQALSELSDFAPARRALQMLADTGLGYVRLAQGTDTLSGGEAQRLFLTAERLAKSAGPRNKQQRSGPTLYLFDEPTRGLHADDVERLLEVFDALVDAGNTVIVVEHDLGVIRHADHVIDLGPGSGPDGGRIVFAGSPSSLQLCPASATGGCLDS